MTFSHLIKLFLCYLKSIFVELGALIIVLATLKVDLSKKIFFKKKGRTCTPILLVHGYMHSSAAWIYISKRLAKAGFGPIFSLNLGSPFHSIEEYALMVEQKADIILKQTGYNDFILIGHSMGGVICSYYATALAPKNRVKAVITIGSPLHGTKLGSLGCSPCTKQMCYQSTFSRELIRRIKENQTIPFFHIGSSTDLMIRPPVSAWVTAPLSSCYYFDDLGHLALLYSPDVSKKIIELCQQLTSAPQSEHLKY